MYTYRETYRVYPRSHSSRMCSTQTMREYARRYKLFVRGATRRTRASVHAHLFYYRIYIIPVARADGDVCCSEQRPGKSMDSCQSFVRCGSLCVHTRSRVFDNLFSAVYRVGRVKGIDRANIAAAPEAFIVAEKRPLWGIVGIKRVTFIGYGLYTGTQGPFISYGLSRVNAE